MVGKWHLGHAQPKQVKLIFVEKLNFLINEQVTRSKINSNLDVFFLQGPTAKGFQSFTGFYLGDLESYTKATQIWTGPKMGQIFGLDWGTEFENGTYRHYDGTKHATLAITEKSIQLMKV